MNSTNLCQAAAAKSLSLSLLPPSSFIWRSRFYSRRTNERTLLPSLQQFSPFFFQREKLQQQDGKSNDRPTTTTTLSSSLRLLLFFRPLTTAAATPPFITMTIIASHRFSRQQQRIRHRRIRRPGGNTKKALCIALTEM